jgi:chromosome segregation protein
MYLKSLVLKGFKSFADRSVLSLEPGITSVVGPNGSGKSNISDAVLWVLGERNAKNLRGQAMEDVIFAGSSARKSLGVAEVDLVLDNSDGTLPIDYDEVALTRRMYRNGESEYLINGSPARRMDFMDILHDTGLGTGTHSIISQGNLDAILASKPEDRRALIEEAAGVLKHKQRKDRSARKLAAMDEHLARVKDVCAEVERQLKPLARKAQRAQAYQGIADELAHLDLVLAVDDLRTLQAQWDATLASEREAAAAIDVEQFRVKEAEQRLEKLQLLLQEKGLYVGDLTAQRGRFHMDAERLDSAVMVLAEKSRSIYARLEAAQNTSSGSTRRISSLEDECSELKERLDEQIASRDSLSSQVDELSGQQAQAVDARKACDSELSDIQSLLRSREREMDEATVKRSKLQDSFSGRISTKRLLESKKEETAAELEQTKRSFDERCRGLDEEARELAELLEKSRFASEEVTAAQQAVADARSALDEARKEKQRIEGQITALEEINRSMRSKNDASAWISEHGRSIEESIAPLAAEVQAPQELERLVELLMGEDLASFYTQDEAAAQRVAEGLIASQAHGDASILVAGSQTPGRRGHHAGVRLIDRLTYPDRLAGTLDAILGDVFLVDSLDEALAQSATDERVRYACPDGTVVWPGAKISVHSGTSADDGVLSRERTLAQLREKDGAASEALANAQSSLEALEGELERKRAMSLELSQTHAQRKGANESAKAERERLAKRVGVLEATLAQIDADLAKADKELAEVEPQIAQLTEAIEQARKSRSDLEERMNTVSGNRALAYEKEQEVSGRLSEIRLSLATAKERVLSLTREHRERERDLDRARKSLERAQRDLTTLEVARARIKPLRDALLDLKESCQVWVEELASKAALEQSNSASLNESINEARAGSRKAKEALEAAQAQLSEVRVAKGRLEVQVETAINIIVEQCGVPLETALETPAPEDRAQTESEAFKLRRRLSSMGTIDSSAAEEYEAAKERYEYMASQVEDMEAARRALKRIVAAIDARMKEQFDVTFDQVNRNFQDIFGTLFPGGSASLSLMGEEDSDSVGVEINAQPRGKKIAKMTLMSGGEKSLTALALLFAVYRIRRTPFYILDEVEAALDDSNLRRLVAYLQTLRHETQLIMITHQRRTMEMSDVLYGVSMQADGVTKVVSQRLEAALPHSNQ